MNKKTRLIIASIIAVVAIVGIGQLVISKQANVSVPPSTERAAFDPQTTETPQTLTTTIDFGNGKRFSEVVAGTTALDALTNAATIHEWAVEQKQFKYGSMVIKIGETANTPEASWVYYVNDKAGNIAAERYEVKPGDNVRWAYESLKK